MATTTVSTTVPGGVRSSQNPLELRARGVTVVDVACRSLSGLAAKIREAEVGHRRDLRGYMALSEVGGSQRLFRYLNSKEPNVVLERLLKGDDYLKTVATPLMSHIATGKDLEKDVEMDDWIFEEDVNCVARIVEKAPLMVDAFDDEPTALKQNEDASEWYAKKLSKSDVALDIVKARLNDAVKMHRDHITNGMDHVTNVQLDVCRANVQTTNARRKLGHATKDSVTDVLGLLQLRRRKQRAETCLDLAKTVREALSDLRSAFFDLSRVDFQAAIAKAASARRALMSEPLDGLAALETARSRARDVLPLIRFSIDGALWKALDPEKKQLGDDLDPILRAYAAVDEAFDDVLDDETAERLEKTMKKIPPSSSEEDLDDDDLDAEERRPLGLWRSGPGHVDDGAPGFGERVAAYCCARVAKFAGAQLELPDDAVEELMKARRLLSSRQLLSVLGDREEGARIDAPAYAKTIVRICRRIVQVLGVADRTKQWHRLKFPEDDALETAVDASWRIGRAVLFEGLKSISDRTRLEDLVCGLAAANVTRCVASTMTTTLDDTFSNDALRSFGRTYLAAIRGNALSVLLQMLDCETWCSISAASLEGDVLLIDDARALELAVAQNLRRVAKDRLTDLAGLCDLTTTEDDDDDGGKIRRFLARTREMEPRARAVLEAVAKALDDKDDDASIPVAAAAAGWVATQAAYHGLCKAATKYAQIALLVDGAEDDVVEALLELFDAYAKNVALTFLPAATLRSIGRRSDDDDDHDDVLACDVASLEAFVALGTRVDLFDDAEDTPNRAATFFAADEETHGHEDMPSEREIRASVVAAHSLTFAGRVLEAATKASVDRASVEVKTAALAKVQAACDAGKQLRDLVIQALGPRLAGADAIVKAIRDVKDAWAAETIQEESNDYVDVAAQRFQHLWTALCYLDRQADDVREAKEALWTAAVQAAFEAVVDGFANVDLCSTEGRALMSMDLQVLQFSLDKIHRARPHRGALYADTYIKAFYFAEDDLLNWIKDNKDSYKHKHMVSLVHARLGKAQLRKKNFLNNLLSRVV